MSAFSILKPNVPKLQAKRDVEGLIKALFYRGDPSIQRLAATALGVLGDPRALEPLLIILWNQGEIWEALRAVIKIGDPRSTEGLGRLLIRSNNHLFQIEIINILGKFATTEAKERISLALEDKNIEVRIMASRELTRLGWRPEDERFQSLLENAKVYDDLRSGRYDEIGDRWVLLPREEIFRRLKSTNSESRQFAARVLGEIGGPQALDALLQHLKAEDQDILGVIGIVDGLGKIGDPSAIEPMLAAYQRFVYKGRSSHKWGEFGKHIVSALISIGHAGMKIFARKLDQGYVIDALGQLGGETAIDLLIQALETTTDGQILNKAAYYLSEMKCYRAVIPLCEVFKRKDGAALEEIACALGKLGDPRALLPLVDALPGIVLESQSTLRFGGHPNVVHALIAMGEPAKEPLKQLLAQQTIDIIREEIVYILEEIESRC